MSQLFWCYDYIGRMLCNICNQAPRDLVQIIFNQFDVNCGTLLRLVVGLPARIDWNQSWRTLLHAWHRCIAHQLKCLGLRIWSAKYLSESSRIAIVRDLQLMLLNFRRSLGETYFGLTIKRWKAWSVIFPMANSIQIFAAWYWPQHRSLDPKLRKNLSFFQEHKTNNICM